MGVKMKNYFMGSILTVAAGLVLSSLALSPLALAQTSTAPPRPAKPRAQAAKSQPDLTGIWQPPSDGLHRRFSPEDAPMQPWALEAFKANREGIADRNLQGVAQVDPNMYCLPSGTPRSYTAPLPFEIVQAPGRVYMIFQTNSQVRYIYTDGRGHPDGFPATFMGHSIGKWDGDTLVVDTVGIDEDSWLDTIGTPHSDALHIVERIRRVDHDTLQVDFLFDDSKAYTKPWKGQKVFKLDPDWEMIPALQCEDRFKAEFSQKTLRDKKYWIEFSK